jgi:putative endonuclease
MTTNARLRAERAGRMAEAAAALWLTMKGYRILARRVRTPVGEIDIVAMPSPHGTLCLIEVKWRPTLQAAAEAIVTRQRSRMTRAAAAYLQRHPHHAAADLRYDALLLAPGAWPRHLRDAWRD